MSTLKCDNLQNSAGTKTVPVSTVVDGSAKAWVNFDGTGTVAIRSSFNVSSISDLGVGYYTLNFASQFSDANYAIIGTARGRETHVQLSAGLAAGEVPNLGSVNIKVGPQGGSGAYGFLEDSAYIFIGIYR